MIRSRLWVVVALAVATSVSMAATTQPATGPAATMGAKSEFPEWAMKAYPDDIVRLMRWDHVKEAEALGKKKLVELAKDPARTPELVQTISSVAHLYMAISRSAEAEALIKNGLGILDTVSIPGEEKELDLARADLEDAQASLSLAKGDVQRAAEFAKSSLDRLKKNLAVDDLRVIDETLEVEHLKIRLADHSPVASSLVTFNRAMRIYRDALGADTAPVADVEMSRGYYFLYNSPPGAQSINQAEQAFTRALDIRKKVFGENSEVANAMEALASIATLKGHDDEAIKILTDARAMTLKVLGEDDPAVAEIDVSIAAALDRSKKSPEEAEKRLLKAISVFEKYSDTREDTADTLEMLSEHYRQNAQEDKADAIDVRAEKIRAELKKRQEL